jgi:hypothetical protein
VRRRLVLRAYDHLVELVADADLLEMAKDRLPPAYRAGRGNVERSWEVDRNDRVCYARVDGATLEARASASSALEAALSDMELWVAENARGFVFVHAGCVARDGRAIVLPARTRAGKTTLVSALAKAGLEYYSDEFAVIDQRGLVRPYARPLSFRLGGIDAQRRHPTELGLTVGSRPARMALVALLRFVEGVGWEVKPVSRAHMILGLLDNTVPAQRRPIESLTAAERATEGARGYRGTRGDAAQAAISLIDLLDA